MCAINPVHKKRIIFDFYTSDKNMPKELFDRIIIQWSLLKELEINTKGQVRCHVKETNQEAD